MTDTIQITFGWRQTAEIVALGLERGDDTGKAQATAKQELWRMADICEHLSSCFQITNCFDDSLVAYAITYADAVNIAQGLANRWKVNFQVTGNHNGEDITLIRTPKPIRHRFVFIQKAGKTPASGGPRWWTAKVYSIRDDGSSHYVQKLRQQHRWRRDAICQELLKTYGDACEIIVTELEG